MPGQAGGGWALACSRTATTGLAQPDQSLVSSSRGSVRRVRRTVCPAQAERSTSTGERIGLTVAPDRLALAPGGKADFTLVVTNQGQVVDTFDLVVEGIDPSWYTLTTASVSLFPGATDTLGLSVHLPESPAVAPHAASASVSSTDSASPNGAVAAAGEHQMHLRVVSRDDASAAAADVVLEVLAVGTLRTELLPQRVILGGLGAPGAWGRYRLRLINEGNADRLVDVAVADDEAALEARLDADRLAVPAGETREVGIALRTKRRPWIAPQRTVPFTVTATAALDELAERSTVQGVGEPGESLGMATGDLTYNAPFAFLAGLPLWLQRLVPLLLALAILLAILAWLLGAAGMQSPIRPRPTPVAEGTPTPEGSPLLAAQATASAQQTVAARAGAPGGATPGGAAGQTAAQQTAAAGAAQLPAISSFELRTPQGGGRGEFELAWDVQRADQVRILDVRGGQKIPLEGVPNTPAGTLRIQVPNLESHEYELEATNRAGTSRRSIGMVILQPPEIVSFTAEPAEVDAGQPVTLTWEVRRAARLGLAGRNETLPAQNSGSVTVPVDADTTFTLVAINDLGRVERAVTVRVR